MTLTDDNIDLFSRLLDVIGSTVPRYMPQSNRLITNVFEINHLYHTERLKKVI